MKKMNRLLLIIFLLGLFINSSAKYYPDDLYKMIIKSEEIVYGTIVEVEQETFTLNIEGSLTSELKKIQIEQFVNWGDARRWTNYEVGQKVLLFLTKKKRKWHIMSAGNEGELPILDNFIFIHALSIPAIRNISGEAEKLNLNKQKFEVAKYKVYGRSYFGHRMNFIEFLKAVSYVRTCFDYECKKGKEIWELNCDRIDIEREATNNMIIKWIYEQTKTRGNKS